MKKTDLKSFILCALFAALSAALSQIMIPIGPVPITLTHISVFLAGGLLGAKHGAVSQSIFVLLGAVGLPVFAGFTGGIGIVTGYTGGFILGYVLCAFAVGLLCESLGRSTGVLVLAMIIGMAVTYLPGILWFMYLTNTGLAPALMTCVIPFLPGDAVKIALSAALVKRLYPILTRNPVSAA